MELQYRDLREISKALGRNPFWGGCVGREGEKIEELKPRDRV